MKKHFGQCSIVVQVPNDSLLLLMRLASRKKSFRLGTSRRMLVKGEGQVNLDQGKQQKASSTSKQGGRTNGFARKVGNKVL